MRLQIRTCLTWAVVVGCMAFWSARVVGGVLPPHSTVDGKTLGEWTQTWWQWAWSLPEDTTNNGAPSPVYEHPLYDVDGSLAHLGDHGDAFFLGGVYRLVTDPAAPGTIVRTRTVTVPQEMRIFFPVVNAASSSARIDRPQDDAGLIAAVNGNMNLITESHASVDGVVIPDLPGHREPSGIFDMTFGPNNIYGVPADRQGTPWHAYADGYWIMLDPLPVGQHQVNFGGTFATATSTLLAFDVTYDITVVPEPAGLLVPAGIGALSLLRPRRRSATR